MVDIVFHEDVDSKSNELQSKVASAARVTPERLNTRRRKVRLTIQERYLQDVAAIDAVQAIEKVHPAQLYNNVARVIMNADVLVKGTKYQGESQVVTVADTGLDIGKIAGIHPAFTGRVAKLYALDPGQPIPSDPNGHGTHTCGSVLGDGFSGSIGGVIQGTAPRTTLVMQSMSDASLPGIPTDLHDLFMPPYQNDNSRVHSNSWGRGARVYSISAEKIDEFVWDHPDMVILFAAGNDGTDAGRPDGVVDLRQIGDEAAAKNCITVGA